MSDILPPGETFCDLSVIDTNCDITSFPHVLLEPSIPGHAWLNLPTYAFYIKNRDSGHEVLFDLGCRKDWQNSVPSIVDMCRDRIPGLKVTHDVIDILEAGSIVKTSIKAAILSHWHYDHCGDPSRLSHSTDLIVGPGFKERFCPGYPTQRSSTFWPSAFEGRNVIEMEFSDRLVIGGFQALDFFGDGSLYILNVPGHAIGHICALVRTGVDQAVLLGGDACHFTGMLRPSPEKSFPESLPIETVRLPHLTAERSSATFLDCHPNVAQARTTPFYRPSCHPESFYVEPQVAAESLIKMQRFDASENILVIIAHDNAPRLVMPFFPTRTLNDWKEQGYKEKMYWMFVNELPFKGVQRVMPLADGLYNDEGQKIRGLLL